MSTRSLNKVMLIGNLTRDPEVRYTSSGATVATFGLATNRSWKNQDGEVQESVEFHNIVVWGKLAEICQQLLKKGSKVYVEGALTTHSWEDENGSTRYKTEVRVDDMILLSSGGSVAKQSDNSSGTDDGTDGPVVVNEVDDQSNEKKNEEENDAKSSDSETDGDVLDDDLPF